MSKEGITCANCREEMEIRKSVILYNDQSWWFCTNCKKLVMRDRCKVEDCGGIAENTHGYCKNCRPV